MPRIKLINQRFPRYSEKAKNNYFYYRLYEMDALDHGIVGADEFFSRLVVNYVKEYRVMAAGDFFRESIYEFHNERGLYFCSEQVKLFSKNLCSWNCVYPINSRS